MKQVAILHYAGPPVVGGVESTIAHHARLLAAAGWRVQVVAGQGEAFSPQVAFSAVREVDSRHPEVLAIGQELAHGQVTARFAALRDQLTDRLGAALSGTDVCIVHNAMTLHKNLPLTAALYQLAERRVTRLVAWCHDLAWQDRLYRPSLHPGYPWDLLRTPWPGVRYVVVSRARRDRLADLLGLAEEAIAVVTPGVDVAAFLKLEPATWMLAQQLALLEADPLLLPARITRRKNIEFAVRVTAALREIRPAAMLVVTGPPGAHNPANAVYLEALQSLRQGLGLGHHVRFLYEHGENNAPLHVTDAMVADLYKLADALLFPSRREGFGIPVLEAGLARLPIFAADIAPIRESAGELAERFDPDGDPGQVAGAIARHLAGDPDYQLKHRVLRYYTWSVIVSDKVIPLLEEVIRHAD